VAVFCAAVSTSKTFPSAPSEPFGVMLKFGSRLKLSMIRHSNPRPGSPSRNSSRCRTYRRRKSYWAASHTTRRKASRTTAGAADAGWVWQQRSAGGRCRRAQSRCTAGDKCLWCADGPGWWAQAYLTPASAVPKQPCGDSHGQGKRPGQGSRYRAQAVGLE
jgi:hypothetical protein